MYTALYIPGQVLLQLTITFLFHFSNCKQKMQLNFPLKFLPLTQEEDPEQD